MIQRRLKVLSGITAGVFCGVGFACFALQGLSTSAKAADPAPASAAAAPAKEDEADEKGIRATADEFVKAFNAGDAKTIGAEWATDAEYTDEAGREFQGRAAIEKEYAALFKQHPGATITVTIESIRFLGPDIAVEKGIAQCQFPKSEAQLASRYNVVHARRDGKWIMVVGRDSPYVAAESGEYLKDLGWLIGEWQGKGKLGMHIKSEWMAQKNFIKCTYTILKDGEPTLAGVQVIGWNPRLGRIVSWHFDAQGGFGNDVWTKDGSKWVIEATGLFRDGSESSAVNVITSMDADTFTWQSIKRTLDGVALPNTPPVKIVRVQAAP